MHALNEYDVVIFDCDGVILDSNKLKIQAMEEILIQLEYATEAVGQCIDYFTNNFGKSRFHHVDHFLENWLSVDDMDKARDEILEAFSDKTYRLYLTAEMTEGVDEVLNQVTVDKYVASGSEQGELRKVFAERGLEDHFKAIYGSPVTKKELVTKILTKHEPSSKAVMIGDAVSDFSAADENGIDFIFYAPYSNVPEKMADLSRSENFPVIEDWREAILQKTI